MLMMCLARVHTSLGFGTIRRGVGLLVLLLGTTWLPAQALETGGEAQGAYTPPPWTGIFDDVPSDHLFAAWIEQLYRDGITLGCAVDHYCPEDPVTRGQMAVFLERTMRGTGTWPPFTVLVHAVVNSSGSIDQAASGQALLDAIASIPATGSPGAPTGGRPWLVKIGPGYYSIHDAELVMREYVDVEGSGPNVTHISSYGSGTPTVRMVDNMELRDLYVSKSAYDYTTAAAVKVDGGSPSITNVTAVSDGATTYSIAFDIHGTDVGTSSTKLTHVYGIGRGAPFTYGISTTSSVTVSDSHFQSEGADTCSYGIMAVSLGGTHKLVVTGSKVSASCHTFSISTDFTARVAATELNGGSVIGTMTCAGVWDESFTFYSSACP